jgi:hypothetical protein
MTANILSLPSIGVGEGCGYRGIQEDVTVHFATDDGTRTMRIVIYGAFDAYGLVGPEKNGIAIFDVDNRTVVCDEIGIETSGYFGASKAQIALWQRLIAMEWDEFQAFVNAQPRTRMEI